MKQLEYKGYTGSIEYSQEDELLYGKVHGIRSLISYEGHSGKELKKDFIQSVDDYILTCNEEGREAEKPFKGSFNVRISSELHQDAAFLAMSGKKSLNRFVAESIREKVQRES